MLELDEDQLSYFQEEAEKIDAKDYKPEIDAQNDKIDSLKMQISDLLSRIQALPAESKPVKKELDQAEVFYGPDGRIKSIRIGNLGAIIMRDNGGKMRTINFKEIGVM